MRIGLVVSGGVDPSGRDRVIPALLWLIEALARRHELHVFVLDYLAAPCTYPLLGATVHDLGRVGGLRGTRRYLLGRRLDRALVAHGPFDVLHAYWAMPAGVVTTRIARREGVPAVVTLDSGELVRCDDIGYGLQRRWVDRRAVRHLLKTATTLTVATEFMRTLVVRQGAAADIIPLGVDAARFPLAERTEGPPWRLIRVGSINRVKDYPTLLAALASLLPRLPDVHLDIVGEDTLGGEMQALAGRLEIDGHTTFHGSLATDQVSALYARAHLNVVSSRHEAANVTVLEAACTGLPTVGTAVGYIADWSPQRAVAVPVQDPGALSRALADLLTSPTRRHDLAARARAWAIAHDSAWTAHQFERLYDRLTTRH
jgi:glycosyltransferase involved in cell wall biosynthesis